MMPIKMIAVLLPVLLLGIHSSAEETLPPLRNGIAPNDFKSMWAGFDPRAEPLETETLKTWEEDGVIFKIVRFRIGIFKGQKATLAAVYGYPKGGTKLPGLVQIHGGGQYADYKACLTNAKRGYATVSIAWAGRISAPGYMVTPKEVKLFWDGKKSDPNYKLTTDWGALDGYHAPSKNPKNNFPSASPAAWTLDPVESPRNSPWFLCAIAGRRALTFLEQQPVVDANKLGVYGHSMGGKLTVMTSIDPRVKAAAPSCGGISDRENKSNIFVKTICDQVSLKEVSCPIIFLSPANDFHGRISDLPNAIDEIKSKDWRVTCSPHHNHQDTAPYEAATLHWFDQHLKGTFQFPKTPKTNLTLKTDNGIPAISVQPDTSHKIISIDIYYTQHGKNIETRFDYYNTVHRFWYHSVAKQSGKNWTATLPVNNTDKPLWVYANVTYELDKTHSGAGYYYGVYETNKLNVSSLLQKITPDQLKTAKVKSQSKRSLVIESFEGDWENHWFTYKPQTWPRATHKLYDEQWQAPENAKLAISVQSEKSNKLLVMIDDYVAIVDITRRGEWQEIILTTSDFKDLTGNSLPNWDNIKRLKLSDIERLKPTRGKKGDSRIVGKRWEGSPPEFRNLRWVTESLKK